MTLAERLKAARAPGCTCTPRMEDGVAVHLQGCKHWVARWRRTAEAKDLSGRS